MKGDSAYEKVLYFNEQLTKTNQYNTSADLSAIDNNCRECISALKGSIGEAGPVCEGYARAFKVLCDAAGIPCTIEEGYAFNGLHTEAHMWNVVEIDNQNYYLDVTWDDSGADESIVYFYFNVSDEMINKKDLPILYNNSSL